jgi:cobalt-zinc-cadmium efflux system outer membrane protein
MAIIGRMGPVKASCLVAGALVLFAVQVRAEDAQPWSLEQAGQQALARSPQVRAAQAALEASRAYRAFAKMPRLANPSLSLRAMVGKPDDPAATYGVAVGLPFDVSGRRRAWRREASWVEREAEAQLAVVMNEARSEARAAFVDVALGMEQERVAQGNMENAGDFLSRVRARFEHKAATALDLALSQRDFAESAADLASAQILLAEAKGRFRQVLDLVPQDAVATVPPPPPSMPDGLTADLAVARAIERRRDPEVFRANEQRQRAADTRLFRESVAPLALLGEGEAQGNTNTQKTGGVGLAWELPLLRRNQGERAVARGLAELANVQGELTERRVGREAMVAYQQLEAALRELDAIEKQATPAAEQALEMTMEMLEAGAVDFFRLLSARQSAFALRARRVAALRAAWRLRIELERAVGGLEAQ